MAPSPSHVLMADAIKARLVSLNRSQRWLAGHVGLTDKHVSAMLTGKVEGQLACWDDMLAAVGLALVVTPRDGDGYRL